MKLWSKNDELDKIIEKFTVGKDRFYDMFLATVSYTHLTLPTTPYV